MPNVRTLFTFLVGLCLCGDLVASSDWTNWRGPNSNGIAAPNQDLPTEWSESQNVIWKVPVPGRGHSSPIVAGDKILLTTADVANQTQIVLCYQRSTGKLIWSHVANEGGLPEKIHAKNTHASPSVATDGTHAFAVFHHDDKVSLTTLDMTGKRLWQKVVGAYTPSKYKFGYAPTPLLYGESVIVCSEFETAGFIAAFDQKTGRELWRTRRPKVNNFSSPVVATVAGKEQLLLSGGGQVTSYEPSTGKENWSVPGVWQVTCGTVVWHDDLVFASGGYPARGTMAVRADGSRKVVWTNNVKCYEQSMLSHQGHIYAIDDNGIAYCWVAETGEEKWKKRLGGPVSSSPILAGGNIYVSNERGTTYVYKPTPKGFEGVAMNQLGSETFATPAIVSDRLYYRIAKRENGQRKEYLFCIGKK